MEPFSSKLKLDDSPYSSNGPNAKYQFEKYVDVNRNGVIDEGDNYHTEISSLDDGVDVDHDCFLTKEDLNNFEAFEYVCYQYLGIANFFSSAESKRKTILLSDHNSANARHLTIDFVDVNHDNGLNAGDELHLSISSLDDGIENELDVVLTNKEVASIRVLDEKKSEIVNKFLNDD